MSEPAPLIQTQGLIKLYRNSATETPALRGVNLSVPTGAFAAVAGPSGSGKSTLLHLLGGLLLPTSGQIWVNGIELTRPSVDLVDYRLRQVGFIFQQYNLMPLLTVLENVEYTMIFQGTPTTERRRRALSVLERVGLKGYENRKPTELSGGQQQRVAIARAVVSKPKLVLADEPTASLDSSTGQAIIDLMKTLNQEEGITLLFATHDESILKRAGLIIRLRDGLISDSSGR